MDEENGREPDYAALIERNRAKALRQKAVGKAIAVLFAVVVVAVVGAYALFLTAGTSGTANDAQQTANTAGSSDVATHTVTDSEGRSVTVPVAPQHVAVLDSFSGELSIMLGTGSQLYGVPGGVMSDAILADIYPGLTGLAKTSGSQVNIEEFVASQVDLALVKGTLSDAERAKLDTAHIPYVVVDYTSLEEQLDAVAVVADALGADAQSRAATLLATYRDMIATVDAHTAALGDETPVRIYHSINGELLTDAADSLGASWIARVGAVSVSAGETATSGQDYNATLEQIYAWAPDVAICNVASTADRLRSDAKWASLPAVSAGRVYAMPIGATRWGQRGSVETPLAMLWLGTVLYPDLYSDVDLHAVVVDYYQKCLGVTLADERYEQVMSGEGIRTSGNGSGGGQ